jgi:hypothetical protein
VTALQVRIAGRSEQAFLVEMSVFACTLEDSPPFLGLTCASSAERRRGPTITSGAFR